MISGDSVLVDQVRRFDRFYAKRLARQACAPANEDFSPADVALLSELLWSEGGGSGAWLAYRLDLDPGYTSRVLKKLEAHGLVVATHSASDARSRIWELTPLGRKFAVSIEAEHRENAAWMLMGVFAPDQVRLVEAMRVIQEVLGATPLRDFFDAPRSPVRRDRSRWRRAGNEE